MCKLLMILMIAILSGYSVYAQDTHYWLQQFGPKSTVLNGSDAATSKDNSAIINNPGGLGFNKLSNLSITTNAYAMGVTKMKDGAGMGQDLYSPQYSIIPLIISGLYKHKKYPKWTVGYALIDKVRYDFQSSARYDGTVNVLNDAYSPGNEEYVSQFNVKNDLTETWAGFSVAYRLSKKLSIGISHFGAYRSQTFNFDYTARAIANTTGNKLEVTTSNFLYYANYYSIRGIFKAGLSMDLGKVEAGVTATFPSFNVYSDATVSSDLTGVNVNIADDSNRYNFVANDRQDELKAKYKSPWSISAGVSAKLGNAKLNLTAEYFGSISPYTMIELKPNDFVRPKGLSIEGSREILSVANGNRSVVNIGIGIEHKLTQKISLLGGLSSDNSYYDENANKKGVTLSVSSARLFHAGLGVMIKRSKSDLCIGFGGAYGRNEVKQLVNISSPQDNFTLSGAEGMSVYSYYSLSIIVGYVYYIK